MDVEQTPAPDYDRMTIQIAGCWCEHQLRLAAVFEEHGRMEDAARARREAENEAHVAMVMVQAVEP